MLSDKSAMANYMNSSVQDNRNLKTCPVVMMKIIKLYPKLRYKVVRHYGELFYEMMSEEETMKKAIVHCRSKEHMLKNQRDIDAYIRDNMNVKMPVDGPLWRIYV